MINLFEYQNKVLYDDNPEGIETFLDDIWNKREKSSYFNIRDNKNVETQRFLQILHKTNEIKSNKYVGVIHFEGNKINLLPKIFFDEKKDYITVTNDLKNEISQIQNHILWWLSYCRKIKFPNYQTSLGSTQNDFFEVLIYLFSKYTRELLNSSIYQQYVEIERELPFIKGRLNTNEYINENISKGRWHKLNCTFEAFVIDNEFNRIIKYVSNLLINATTNQDNKKYLREILFILDTVSDEPATAEQCGRISFNPIFAEFETVRDYCELFLSNSISFDYKNELKLFAFLLPMEYVFEDFIFGFIEKETSEISAISQASNTYLDKSNTFMLKPDLWLKIPDKSIIADTKYKIVYSDENDAKKGISQSDIYQMLAYAVRFEVDEILLFYPDTITQYHHNVAVFQITDSFADKDIYIKAYQIPIINHELLSNDLNPNICLSDLFESTKEKLKSKLLEIIFTKIS
jgi:5-methylcytosine-specific restriction enzyme subunit McrC